MIEFEYNVLYLVIICIANYDKMLFYYKVTYLNLKKNCLHFLEFRLDYN